MRPPLLSVLMLLFPLTGCQRPPAPVPVPHPGASHREPELDWGEKGLICQTMIAFQGAFIRGDASGCLHELTPELRRRYRPAFATGAIFAPSGKTNQEIIKWSDSVRVEEIHPPHAHAAYRMLQAPPRGQVGWGHVELLKLDGRWKIAVLGLEPTPRQTQSRTRGQSRLR